MLSVIFLQAHKSRPNMNASLLRGQIHSILEVFVDARSHMSRSRAVALLSQVTSVVGTREYLWLLVAMLVESAVRNDVKEKQKAKAALREGETKMEEDTTIMIVGEVRSSYSREVISFKNSV